MVSLDLQIQSSKCIIDAEKRPYINWKNKCIRDTYSQILSALLNDITVPVGTDEQTYVNVYCSEIVNAMHEAANRAVNVSDIEKQNKHRPKHWWNCYCTTARNRNKFWFNLLRSLNRPREGAVYEA